MSFISSALACQAFFSWNLIFDNYSGNPKTCVALCCWGISEEQTDCKNASESDRIPKLRLSTEMHLLSRRCASGFGFTIL